MFSSSVFIDEEVPRMLLWREEEALGSSLFLVMVSLPERQERQVLCVSINQAAVLWADRKQEEGSSKDLWSLMLVKTWLCTKRCHFVVRINWVLKGQVCTAGRRQSSIVLCWDEDGEFIYCVLWIWYWLRPNCISWKRLSSPGPSGNIHSWKNPTTVTCWSGAGCVTRPDTALQAPQCSWRSSSCSCGVR